MLEGSTGSSSVAPNTYRELHGIVSQYLRPEACPQSHEITAHVCWLTLRALARTTRTNSSGEMIRGTRLERRELESAGLQRACQYTPRAPPRLLAFAVRQQLISGHQPPCQERPIRCRHRETMSSVGPGMILASSRLVPQEKSDLPGKVGVIPPCASIGPGIGRTSNDRIMFTSQPRAVPYPWLRLSSRPERLGGNSRDTNPR